MSGSLMPDPSLYYLLVPWLSPAAYIAALRADKQLWLRTHRVDGYGLPSPAQLFGTRLMRALDYPEHVKQELLDHLQQGSIWLSGTLCLAILNGDPIACANGLPYMLDIMYVKTQSIINYSDDDDEEEDWDLFGAPRKAKFAMPPLLETMRAEPGWIGDFPTAPLVCVDFQMSMAGHIQSHNIHMRWYARTPPNHKIAGFGFMDNVFTGAQLYVRNLDAVLARQCMVSTQFFASNAVSTDIYRDNEFVDIRNEVLTLISRCAQRGYTLRVHHDANEIPAFPPVYDVSYGISTPKQVMGRYHPIECPNTTECGCYQRKTGFLPYSDCMSLHDKCECDAHKAWPALVRYTRNEELKVRHATQWNLVWAELNIDINQRPARESSKKRLCFDDAE